MDSTDDDGAVPSPEPVPPRPVPSPGPPRPGVRVQWEELSFRLDSRLRRTRFVPDTEHVVIDTRRHPALLVAPGLRTLAGVVALATDLHLHALAAFAGLTAVWAVARHTWGVRRTLTVAAGAAVALVAVDGVWGGAAVVGLLLLWLAEDVADWLSDRLVVTDKRIYRRYGVITGHAPSISLTAVAYLDAAVPPIGRLLHYGTLRLDSAAQNDAPLSRFDLVPDVVDVSHEILRLRSRALPKFPQT